MRRTESRILIVLIYYLGGLLVVAGVAIGSGLNRAPLWQALVPPMIFGLCIGTIENTTDNPLPLRRAVMRGATYAAVGCLIAVVAFCFGPPLVWG